MILTVPEAADELRVCKRTIYRMVKEGKFEAFKIGGVWRIPRDSMFEALRYHPEPAAQQEEPTRPAVTPSTLREKVAQINERRTG